MANKGNITPKNDQLNGELEPTREQLNAQLNGDRKPTVDIVETEEGVTITAKDYRGTSSGTVYNGKDGIDGVDGKDGRDGIDGKDGVDGKDGIDGKDGKDGVDGQDGYTPIKGIDYFDGQDGQDGKDGKDGKDAQLTILKYGISTWNDFITAYANNLVIYTRASSGSNPASGSQTRLAFMAYVNNETNPTEVEFQYYRSVNSHSDAQQGDQVFVYKLTSAGTWTVTTRNAFTKIDVGSGLSKTYSNGTLTINLDLQAWTGGEY